MLASAKNILIGIFVLVAFAIIIFMLLFLHPRIGDEGHTLYVRFTDIDKVNIGTRVTYAGRPVGEVTAIRELPDSRTALPNHRGEIYVYELVLKVDSSANVYNTDIISVRTSGLLGEKNIDINPQPLQPEEKLYLVNDQILYAVPSESIESTLKQFSDLSQKVDRLLDNLNITVGQINKDKIVGKVAHAIQNVVDITDSLNQPEKWNQILTNIWHLSNHVNQTWDQEIHPAFSKFHDLTQRAHNSWGKIDKTLTEFRTFGQNCNISCAKVDEVLEEFRQTGINARHFTQQIQEIISYTRSGRGTLGRLFIGEDLYLSLRSILHKGQTIANDVNRFGILFQNNRKWQRLNAKRMNLVGRLSTPEQFNAYFSEEVDEISSSLSQVSMVLNETSCYPQNLMENPCFIESFAELLKKVRDVEDALEMYNEQVIDQNCSE